jgi:hypothetical protein
MLNYLFEIHNNWLGDSIVQGRLLALSWCSWTSQSPRLTSSLDYLSVGLSSNPYAATLCWFLLPIGWLQYRCFQPRHQHVLSASGFYWHQQWLISTTRKHHIAWNVLNVGEKLSGGDQIHVTINQGCDCWLYVQGRCDALPEVRRVCWTLWRL